MFVLEADFRVYWENFLAISEHQEAMYCVEILGAVLRCGHVKKIFWVKAFPSVFLRKMSTIVAFFFLSKKWKPTKFIANRRKFVYAF